MDVYDRAAERAQQLQNQLIECAETRPLTRVELASLCEYLDGTEMSVPQALHGLKLGLKQLMMDDLDRLAQRLLRCSSCHNWTDKAALVNGVCPDCLQERGD